MGKNRPNDGRDESVKRRISGPSFASKKRVDSHDSQSPELCSLQTKDSDVAATGMLLLHRRQIALRF